MTTLVFPETLRSTDNDEKPYVRLTIPHDAANVIKTDITSVCLFMADEMAGTADSAVYNEVDLGTSKALQRMTSNRGSVTGADMEVATIAIIGKIPGISEVGGTETIKIASRAAFNQQKAQTFEGVGIREFTLSYTLVATNPNESNIMYYIENFFRKFLYPEAKGAWSLKFPPLFRVDFMIGVRRNPYLPVYYDSFLTSLDVAMNPNGRAFFANGAPTSMSLTLGFKESKQLTRNNLYSEGLRPNMTRDGMRPVYPDAPPLNENLKRQANEYQESLKTES